MPHDRHPGPLASLPFSTTELAIITPSGPVVELPIHGDRIPVAKLVAHLRALNPRMVIVLPIDLAPCNAEPYAAARDVIFAVLQTLGICVEHATLHSARQTLD